jgi:hypothetical protein
MPPLVHLENSQHSGQSLGCDDQDIDSYLDFFYADSVDMGEVVEAITEGQSEVSSILEPPAKCWQAQLPATPREFVHPRRLFDTPRPLSSAPITEEKAIKLMKKFHQIPSLAFNYTEDGCYARAHMMAYYLEKKGIQTEKVWLSGGLRPTDFPSIAWRYHVAPVVWVTSQGQTKRMVLDRALSPFPLTLEEWSLKMGATPGTHPHVPESTMKSFLDQTSPPPGITLSAGTAYMPGENPAQQFVKEDIKQAQAVNLNHWKEKGKQQGKWKTETCHQYQQGFHFNGGSSSQPSTSQQEVPALSPQLMEQIRCLIQNIKEEDFQGLD